MKGRAFEAFCPAALFATLELLEPQKRGGWMLLRRRNAVSVCRTPLPQAFSFYQIRVEARPDAIPWQAVAEAAGSLRNRMLLPNGLVPGPQIRRFSPRVLPTLLLFETAVQTLHTLRPDPVGRTVCLADPDGLLQNEAKRLLPFGSAFLIAAPPGIYEETARRWLAQSGVAPVLCRSLPRNLDARSIVIANSAAAVPLSFGGVLFTNAQSRFPFASVYPADPPVLPAALEACRPSGIDPLLFASAAAELCRFALPGFEMRSRV